MAKTAKKTSAMTRERHSQKQKLLSLLKIFQDHTDPNHGITTPKIIEALAEQGISAERKSIYQDIKALNGAGFEIRKLETQPITYAYVNKELAEEDIMLLVDLVLSSPFLTDAKERHLLEGLQKLVSVHERQKLNKRVHVRKRIKNQNDSIFYNVDKIHEIVSSGKKIEFQYCKLNNELKKIPIHDGKRYMLTPIKIIYLDNNYYLAAYSDAEESIKTFRVDRMRAIKQTDQNVTKCKAISEYEASALEYMYFGAYEGEKTTVCLRVNEGLMDVAVDRFGSSIDITKATDKWADIHVEIQVNPQFFGWIAGLNKGISIRTPRKIAQGYQDWLKQLLKK